MPEVSDSDLRRLRAVVNLGGKEMPMESLRELRMEKAKPKLMKDPTANFQAQTDPDSQLFVKIEEHESVINELRTAREDIKTIAATIELLAKAEKLKAEAIDRMEQHVSNFDDLLGTIESKIVPPEDILPHTQEHHPARAVDKTLKEMTDLGKDLKSLKERLSKLK